MNSLYVLLNVFLFYVIATFVTHPILVKFKLGSLNRIYFVWVLESIMYSIFTVVPMHKLVFTHNSSMVTMTFIIFTISHFIVDIILGDVYMWMKSMGVFQSFNVSCMYHIFHFTHQRLLQKNHHQANGRMTHQLMGCDLIIIIHICRGNLPLTMKDV